MKAGQKVIIDHLKNRSGHPCVGYIQSVSGDLATVRVYHVGSFGNHLTDDFQLADLRACKPEPYWTPEHFMTEPKQG